MLLKGNYVKLIKHNENSEKETQFRTFFRLSSQYTARAKSPIMVIIKKH
jgi:hypothetical protein